MNKKILLFSVAAAFSLMLVVAASAAAVFAFTVVEEPAPVEVMTLEDAPVEVAPVQAEMVAPVLQTEKATYKSGCSYSKSNLQLTEAPVEQTVDEAPLAQLDR